MESTLFYYTRLLVLLAVLIGVVGFNVAAWGLHRVPLDPIWYVPGPSAARGRVLLHEHGCGACHTVPGVRGAVGKVGPPLDRLKEQVYIAGVLANTPPNLTFWIQNPQEADPRTAMPDLNVSEQDARDIAAYLYALP